MVVAQKLPIFRIFWSLRHTLFFFLIVSTAFATAHDYFKWETNFQVSLTVIGLALSIFLGNRVKFAYDRWWEGRKLWGRMINRSRIITRQYLNFIHGSDANQEEVADFKKKLVLRHIAYVHVLRVSLRSQDISKDESCLLYLSEDEVEQLKTETNPCNALIQMQGNDLRFAMEQGWISEYMTQQIDLSLVELLDVQGGAERIQKTPIPTSFTYFSTRLVFLYSILLSIGLVKTLHWWTIPTVVMVGFIFRIIDLAGKLIENPFGVFYYGLPLTAMSRTIEANLCDRIGKEPRPIPKPVNGVLM